MTRVASESSKQTHYDILKIHQSATQEEIKFAYRSLIINCHPDKQIANNTDKKEENTCEDVIISSGLSAIDIDEDTNEDTNDNGQIDDTQSNKNKQTIIPSSKTESISNTIEEKQQKETRLLFHNIQAAYNCLRDPMKRRQYDEHISRNDEKESWKLKGAIEVNLSEMECDWCCVVDEDDDSNNTDDERNRGGSITHDINDDDLQKVFFHPCRCGDTFQIVKEELLESIDGTKCSDGIVLLTNRVWQCDSCCLTIRIHVDDINII